MEFPDEKYKFLLYRVASPAPINSSQEFGDKVLSSEIRRKFRYDVNRFLKKNIHPTVALDKMKPSKYNLELKSKFSDRLYWDWKVNDMTINLNQGDRGVMLHLVLRNFIPEIGIQKSDLAKLLFDTINYDYKTIDELATAFNLSGGGVGKEGFVITNVPDDPNIRRIHEQQNLFNNDRWKTDTVGFISKTGIYLFFHTPTMRKFIPTGEESDPMVNWLRAEIYESDGKTIVLPKGVTELPPAWKEKLAIREKAKADYNTRFRQWHGRNGKVMFRAEYIIQNDINETVTLEHEDGQRIDHKKYEFCKDDWDYARKLHREGKDKILRIYGGIVDELPANNEEQRKKQLEEQNRHDPIGDDIE
ncbi:MAG: hypothetical protein LBK82_08915 [Planctomycetaceae bacterium]|nr:hypothetical protein [Planctomycetaceae bacterium]